MGEQSQNFKKLSDSLVVMTLETIDKLLPHPSAISSLRQNMLILQGLLTDNPENKKSFIDNGGINILQQCLKKYSTNPKKNKRILRGLIAVVGCFPEVYKSEEQSSQTSLLSFEENEQRGQSVEKRPITFKKQIIQDYYKKSMIGQSSADLEDTMQRKEEESNEIVEQGLLTRKKAKMHTGDQKDIESRVQSNTDNQIIGLNKGHKVTKSLNITDVALHFKESAMKMKMQTPGGSPFFNNNEPDAVQGMKGKWESKAGVTIDAQGLTSLHCNSEDNEQPLVQAMSHVIEEKPKKQPHKGGNLDGNKQEVLQLSCEINHEPLFNKELREHSFASKTGEPNSRGDTWLTKLNDVEEVSFVKHFDYCQERNIAVSKVNPEGGHELTLMDSKSLNVGTNCPKVLFETEENCVVGESILKDNRLIISRTDSEELNYVKRKLQTQDKEISHFEVENGNNFVADADIPFNAFMTEENHKEPKADVLKSDIYKDAENNETDFNFRSFDDLHGTKTSHKVLASRLNESNVNSGGVNPRKGRRRFKAKRKIDGSKIKVVREAENELKEEIKHCILQELVADADGAERSSKLRKLATGIATPIKKCWNLFFKGQ